MEWDSFGAGRTNDFFVLHILRAALGVHLLLRNGDGSQPCAVERAGLQMPSVVVALETAFEQLHLLVAVLATEVEGELADLLGGQRRLGQRGQRALGHRELWELRHQEKDTLL